MIVAVVAVSGINVVELHASVPWNFESSNALKVRAAHRLNGKNL